MDSCCTVQPKNRIVEIAVIGGRSNNSKTVWVELWCKLKKLKNFDKIFLYTITLIIGLALMEWRVLAKNQVKSGITPVALLNYMPPGSEGTYYYRIHHSVHGDIGTSRITIQNEDDRKILDNDVDIKVKLGFITVYRQHKKITEIWYNGDLQSFTVNKDVGDEMPIIISGKRREDDSMIINIDDQNLVAPPEITSGLSWHKPGMSSDLTSRYWLDMDEGKIIQVTIAKPVSEVLQLDGREFTATRYDVTGDIERSQWYDQDGKWLQTQMSRSGTVTMRRVWE